MLLTKKLKKEALSASPNKIVEDFALKLYKDSNIVASQIEIHFFYITQLVLNIK